MLFTVDAIPEYALGKLKEYDRRGQAGGNRGRNKRIERKIAAFENLSKVTKNTLGDKIEKTMETNNGRRQRRKERVHQAVISI